jgi:HlyD family secretion protein
MNQASPPSDEASPLEEASLTPPQSDLTAALPPLPPAGTAQRSVVRRWAPRVLVLLVVIGAGYALQRAALAPDPVDVQVVAVERGPVEATVTNSRAGTVRARRRAQLSPEIGGRVVEIPFREGQVVEAGAVLLRLESTIQEAQLEVAQRTLATAGAQRAEARVRAELALRVLERQRRLAADEVISPDLLDQAETSYQSALAREVTAQAQVAQAEAQHQAVQAALDQTVLRAPFGGILAEVNVELGEWITPSPPLLSVPGVIDLIDPSSIYVSAPMDEVDSSVVQPGQAARVTIDPFPDREFMGRVARVAAYVLDVEEQNRTVEIEVELDDREAAAALLPGTSADVEVILEVTQDTLRLPTSVVIEGRRVLLVEDGTLVERELRPGLKNWNYTQVLDGLVEGQQVVSNLGHAGVEAEARVRVAGQRDGAP